MIALRQLSACALVVAVVAGATIAAHPAHGAGGAGAAAAGDDDDDGRDMVILPRKAGPRLGLPGKSRALTAADNVTRCGACHLVEGWEKVRFNHDPTGFPLRGAHLQVTCTGCHTKGFDKPVANTCSGCHRDRHAGEFGLHCEGCHDDKSWRPLFQADAHRNSNFPLVGKHALIPCNECHGNLRDRTFSRAASSCDACHERDFLRTAATSIDHTANNFSRDCQTCHNTMRFFPTNVKAHDFCFILSGGSHQALRCLNCHTSLSAVAFNHSCMTGTSTCSECHSHACPRSDQRHKGVMAYQCANTLCYQCHIELHPQRL